MSRLSVSNGLMFGGPLVGIVVAFIVGMMSVPSACGGNCEPSLAADASHRQLIILVCLAFAVASAIAGYLVRASVPDEQR